jgi:hypothetical protein
VVRALRRSDGRPAHPKTIRWPGPFSRRCPRRRSGDSIHVIETARSASKAPHWLSGLVYQRVFLYHLFVWLLSEENKGKSLSSSGISGKLSGHLARGEEGSLSIHLFCATTVCILLLEYTTTQGHLVVLSPLPHNYPLRSLERSNYSSTQYFWGDERSELPTRPALRAPQSRSSETETASV